MPINALLHDSQETGIQPLSDDTGEKSSPQMM